MPTCGNEVERKIWWLQNSKESAVDATTGKERAFNYLNQQEQKREMFFNNMN